jgi:hypothetical protein
MGSIIGGAFPPVTVRMAEPVVFPDLAMIIVVVVVAVETATAKPLLSIVATSRDEVQITDDVRFVVELFE